MNLKALSHYEKDTDTRFGDCILIYDSGNLVVYDCGHPRHAEEVILFLNLHSDITSVSIVVSHNDSDHTSGVCELLKRLKKKNKYNVKIYSHQYLKYVDTILNKLDDGRRSRDSLKEAILSEFNNIKDICDCTIVGPTEDQFTDCAVKAVDKRADGYTGEETEMNAASVQLRCSLEGYDKILLCGDAAPSFLNSLNNYQYIQIPHHGKLENAEAIFDRLEDPYSKFYLVSDNTGSGATSGGSDELTKYMATNKFNPAFNTRNGVIDLPKSEPDSSSSMKPSGVMLGDLDSCK